MKIIEHSRHIVLFAFQYFGKMKFSEMNFAEFVAFWGKGIALLPVSG